MGCDQVPVSERVWRLGLTVYLFGLLVLLVDYEDTLGNNGSASVVMFSGLIGLFIMALSALIPVKHSK